MTVKTLDELRQPDDRTLDYTPWGLGPNMRPEDAVESSSAWCTSSTWRQLVADGTRHRLEDLWTVFARGVLCFEIYTMVFDQALFVFEKALRDRFVEVYQGTVTLIDDEGRDRQIVVSRYSPDTQRSVPSGNAITCGFTHWRLSLPE